MTAKKEFLKTVVPLPQQRQEEEQQKYEEKVKLYESWGYTEKFLEVRDEVIERDKGKCKACGKRVFGLRKRRRLTYFQVHHMNGNKQDDCLTNLLTLCARCHQSVHTGYFGFRLKHFKKRRKEIEEKLRTLRETLLKGEATNG